jgi:oligoribonuclease NrnB/cAMP/cGMP phosphodiesterase (DHH superfamily)
VLDLLTVNTIIYDHHLSTFDICGKFEFVRVKYDADRSASKIVYDEIVAEGKGSSCAGMKEAVEIVNAADIFLTEDEDTFKKGRLLTGLFRERVWSYLDYTRHSAILRDFMHQMLLGLKDIEWRHYDQPRFEIMLISASSYLSGTLTGNRYNSYVENMILLSVTHLEQKRTIKINDIDTIVTFEQPNVSDTSKILFDENPNLGIYVNVSKNGTMSFRGRGRRDLSVKVKEWFGDGCFHYNASGCKYNTPIRDLDHAVEVIMDATTNG